MQKFTWILTPDLTGIDIYNLHNYSCYDDECLISTFYRDEILDFLDDNSIEVIDYILTKGKFQYKLTFNADIIYFNNIIDSFIGFKTGRFKTTSIYMATGESAWSRIWKRGTFYNMHLLGKN